MPIALISAYAELLPKLRAEEAREAVANITHGVSQRMDERGIRERDRALEREVHGGGPQPKAAKASLEQLAAMGIGVTAIPAEPANV